MYAHTHKDVIFLIWRSKYPFCDTINVTLEYNGIKSGKYCLNK